MVGLEVVEKSMRREKGLRREKGFRHIFRELKTRRIITTKNIQTFLRDMKLPRMAKSSIEREIAKAGEKFIFHFIRNLGLGTPSCFLKISNQPNYYQIYYVDVTELSIKWWEEKTRFLRRFAGICQHYSTF